MSDDLIAELRKADKAIGGVLISHFRHSEAGTEGAKLVVNLKAAAGKAAFALAAKDTALSEMRAELERVKKALEEARGHFRVEYPASVGGRLSVSYDSEALPKVIAILDAASAASQDEGEER